MMRPFLRRLERIDRGRNVMEAGPDAMIPKSKQFTIYRSLTNFFATCAAQSRMSR